MIPSSRPLVPGVPDSATGRRALEDLRVRCFSRASLARSSPPARTRAWSATSCCWRGPWIPHGTAEGNYLVAVDTVDAGVGETVLIVSGSSARMASGMKDCPVDAAVVGIIDQVDLTE